MARLCFRGAFHFGIPGARATGAGRARLALALTVSLLLHVWLGAGIALEGPWPSLPPPAARPFTARLQPLAVAPEPEAVASEPEARPGQNVASPEPQTVRPAPSRAGVKPPADPESASEEHTRAGAARASVMSGGTPGLALPPPQSSDTYYTAHDLDVYPAPRRPLKLEYPERAARAQVSGRVLVILALNEAGIVDDISLARSEPQGYFEDAVRAALRVAPFFPAQINGLAVKSRIMINVEFNPDASRGVVR